MPATTMLVYPRFVAAAAHALVGHGMIFRRHPWLLLFALLLVGDLLDQPFRLPFFEQAQTTVAVAPRDGLTSIDSHRALLTFSHDRGARPIRLKDTGGVSPALPASQSIAVHPPTLPWDHAVASGFAGLLAIPLRC